MHQEMHLIKERIDIFLKECLVRKLMKRYDIIFLRTFVECSDPDALWIGENNKKWK